MVWYVKSSPGRYHSGKDLREMRELAMQVSGRRIVQAREKNKFEKNSARQKHAWHVQKTHSRKPGQLEQRE